MIIYHEESIAFHPNDSLDESFSAAQSRIFFRLLDKIVHHFISPLIYLLSPLMFDSVFCELLIITVHFVECHRFVCRWFGLPSFKLAAYSFKPFSLKRKNELKSTRRFPNSGCYFRPRPATAKAIRMVNWSSFLFVMLPIKASRLKLRVKCAAHLLSVALFLLPTSIYSVKESNSLHRKSCLEKIYTKESKNGKIRF